jgi:predicted Zn-ribbon and HTH transcriptional regulator
MATRTSESDAREVLLGLGLKPLEPFVNSKTKWKSLHLVCGTECYPTLERAKLGQVSCPNCRYKKVAESLRFSNQKAVEIMRKAGYEPTEQYVNALTKWPSVHIKCGSLVSPTLNQIQNGQGGCLSCGHKETGLKKRNSISKVEEKLISKGFELIGEYTGSKDRLKVLCLKCQTTFDGTWNVISKKTGRGCVVCSRNAAADRYRMDTTEVRKRLKIAKMELVGIYKSSNRPVECLCLQCGKVRKLRLSSLHKGGGCKPCGMKAAGKLRRTDELVAIEIMREIGKVEPLEPYAGQNAVWKSCCLVCQKIVYPRLSSIKSQNGLGCLNCANRARGISRRIPQSVVYEFLIKEGFIPLDSEKFVDANTDIKCTHTCGSIVRTSYRKVLANKGRGNGSCRPCGSKKYADSNRFDIAIIDKIYAKQNLRLATRKYLGMRYMHPTSCNKCGWKWDTLPSKIALGHGCPVCSKGSFKPNSPAYFYLITHNEFGAHKVGIANIAKTSLGDRFYHHKKQGWILVARWDSNSGEEIKVLEKEILRTLRKDMKVPPYLAKTDMPFGGWTETLSADAISVTKLRDLIERKILDLKLEIS